MQPRASGNVWLWVLLQERSPGTSRLAAGLGCNRKNVGLRLSDPQCFRVLGFVSTQLSDLCRNGDVGAGGSRAQAAGLVLCPPGGVFGSGRASSASGVGKRPSRPRRQMAAGLHRSLPRPVDANPAGFPTLLLPPYIPGSAMVTGPAWQPGLCTVEVSVQPESLCSSALPESCSSGDTSLRMGCPRRFPRHGTKWSRVTAGLSHPLSPPALPSAGDGPAVVLQGWDTPAKPCMLLSWLVAALWG